MGPVQAAEVMLLAKVLRFCKFCRQEAPHEIRNSPERPHVVCVRCRERALLEELDRD